MVEAQVREGDVQADVEVASGARVPENVGVEASRYVTHDLVVVVENLDDLLFFVNCF